jgi:hypothetical protein
MQVWRNSYNAKNEPVKFAGGWIVGSRWKTTDWKNNPHAVIEVRELEIVGGTISRPISDGDAFYSHDLLNKPDPNAKFFHAKTGLPYTKPLENTHV